MNNTPFRILLLFSLLLPLSNIAQQSNTCSSGNSSRSFNVYHISFCLPDDFKETARESNSLLFFSSNKKTIRVSVFSIRKEYDDINKYFSATVDAYIKNINQKGFDFVVDSVGNNEEKPGNMPAGFKKYKLVYRLLDNKSGVFYFMVFDYIKKITETTPTYKHGISVFQMINDGENEMKTAGINSTLIFSSMNAKNF